MLLTKAELLRDSKVAASYPIEALQGNELRIRGLTQDEFTKIEAFLVKALDIQFVFQDNPGGGEPIVVPKFDISRFAAAEHQSKVMAVGYGLSVDEDSWEIAEVLGLGPAVVDEVSAKVYEITGKSPQLEDAFTTLSSMQDLPVMAETAKAEHELAEAVRARKKISSREDD